MYFRVLRILRVSLFLLLEIPTDSRWLSRASAQPRPRVSVGQLALSLSFHPSGLLVFWSSRLSSSSFRSSLVSSRV